MEPPAALNSILMAHNTLTGTTPLYEWCPLILHELRLRKKL